MDDGYISPPSLPPTSRSYLPAPFEFEFYSLLFYEYLRFVWFCRERAKSSSQSSYSPHKYKYKIAPLSQKIWLTQEADAKSWSLVQLVESLKHVQPKEGRKELAPRAARN
jgi:hypothetical protein